MPAPQGFTEEEDLLWGRGQGKRRRLHPQHPTHLHKIGETTACSGTTSFVELDRGNGSFGGAGLTILLAEPSDRRAVVLAVEPVVPPRRLRREAPPLSSVQWGCIVCWFLWSYFLLYSLSDFHASWRFFRSASEGSLWPNTCQ